MSTSATNAEMFPERMKRAAFQISIRESNSSKPDVNSLPQETIDFARRIFDACRNGDTELVLAAIDAGLPANLTNDKGNTLLMLAAYAGHTELAKGLLDRGGDPNRTNDLGQSIVAGAVFKGHDEIVRALVAKGADSRQGTPNAIQAAQMFRRTDLMELLGARDEDLVKIPTPPPAADFTPDK
ncbi:Putative ankyrin repeat protein [Psilocybe cubensis]|uniref:Ankyrin repeat protein n=2 Tax=Psilocybe cubensis TaxID=181762 RepID=A0ACB8GIQ5_PSICU|nr:Putative ankyrin repeat protein [Psilocybe cubensis]KAH9475091.1 Putative ankyrin repeat protein [Psilocybe cubensis]